MMNLGYFEEFQRQQKELKDQDRQNKAAAATGLSRYQGGEHDIKHARALADIRAETRLRKVSAVRNQRDYKDQGGLAAAVVTPEKKPSAADASVDSSQDADDGQEDQKVDGTSEEGFMSHPVEETEGAIEAAAQKEAAEKRAILDAKKAEEERAAAEEAARAAEAAAAAEAAEREAAAKKAAEEEAAARMEAEKAAAAAAAEKAARIQAKRAEEEARAAAAAEAKRKQEPGRRNIVGFEEFRRQQKELKEQDRQKKTDAATGLNQYKGGEHDIKHAKALAQIRAETRLRKASAVRRQHAYKDYQPSFSPEKMQSGKTKGEVMADVSLYSNEDDDDNDDDGNMMMDDLPEEGVTTNRMEETEEAFETKGQKEVYEMQAILEENNTEEEEAAVEEAKRVEEEEKMAAQQKEKMAAQQAAKAKAKKEAEAAWKLKIAEDLARAEEEEAARVAEAAAEAKKQREIDELAAQWSKAALAEEDGSSAQDEKGAKDKSHGCKINLDFTFGLFYPSTEGPPDWDVCTQAAAGIVPNKISSGKAPVTYDPAFPPVVKSVKKDDAFRPMNPEQKGLCRFVVRGTVPVSLRAKTEDEAETAPVRRNLLKKQSSFVPVRRMESTVEVVVENEQGDQWKRVRKGKPVAWEEIVEKKPVVMPCMLEE